MGAETGTIANDPAQVAEFVRRLAVETDLLCTWLADGEFGDGDITCGNELEGWLLDSRFRATTANTRFLDALGMPEAVPELARFNIEFNGRPKQVPGHGLAAMHAELLRWLNRGASVAESLGLHLLFIGSLPSLEESDISLGNISLTERYKALDEAISRYRGAPEADIHISGRDDEYRGRFDSIMIESATTSFQLHLQVPASESVAWYNAAVAATGPVWAMAANSPFLFGKALWAETRIPVFVQSVNSQALNSVTFGTGYLTDSWAEIFGENLDFPTLLPELLDDPSKELPHLKLHNSTVWRWNRPIIDVAGRRLRIEHRALPAGPTVADMVANSALFFGLVAELAASDTPIQDTLPFEQAERNFYAAARDGVDARLHWRGNLVDAPGLILDELLDTAAAGLRRLEVDAHEAEEYLHIIEERARKRTNGALWQLRYVERHGKDMQRLIQAYAEQQLRGRPVAQWSV